MIQHPIKPLNIRPKPTETQQWGFPGSNATSSAAGSSLPPGSHAIPKAEEHTSAAVEEPVQDVSSNSIGLDTVVYKPDAETNSEYYSVKLPTDFLFYDFKSLSVKKVTGRVQAKFTRAGAEGNARYLVEGVSSLLGDGISAFDLSAYDFKYLLHFILLLSYPVSPRKVVAECESPEHHQRVREGLVEEATLREVINYDRPALKETILDIDKLKSLDLSALSNFSLGVYTMRDAIDWEENYAPKFPKGRADEETQFIYDLAAYLKGGTLEDRAELVREMSVPQFRALEAYREVAQDHGVEATLKHTCKECGAETVTDVTVSVRDFL